MFLVAWCMGLFEQVKSFLGVLVMDQQLNIAFVADKGNKTAFFLWLTHTNGMLARTLNKSLKNQLSASLIWREFLEKHKAISGKLELEKEQDVKSDGIFLTMEAAFELFKSDRYVNTLPPWILPSESWRFFSEIVNGITVLLENGHFYPMLTLVKSEDILYVSGQWVLRKNLLKDSGMLSRWLHRIPEEALSPKVVAPLPLKRWFYAVVDSWVDRVVRQKLKKAYQAEVLKWPEHDFYKKLSAEWFYHLIQEPLPYYKKIDDPYEMATYEDFQKSIRAFVQTSYESETEKEMTAFKKAYLDEWLEPLQIDMHFEPQERTDPFLPGADWYVELVIQAYKGTKNHIGFFSLDDLFDRRENGLIEWVNDRLTALTQFNKRLKVLEYNTNGMISTDDVLDLYNHREEFKSKNIQMLFPDWMKVRDARRQNVQVDLDVSSSHSVFTLDSLVDFDWRISIGKLGLTTEQFEQLVREQRRFHKSGDEWIELPLDQLNALYTNLRESGAKLSKRGSFSDAMRFSLAQKDNLSHPIDIRMDTKLEHYLSSIIHKPDKNKHVPTKLQGNLRPYQKRGYSWLSQLKESGVGGCLADDMGLGKTIQTITYLLKHTQDHPDEPALIVCPTSVIGNWVREIRAFAPSLSIYTHHGQDRLSDKAFKKQVASFDVVVTSYTLIVNDKALLDEQMWSALILDEAQAIKNPSAKKSQALRSYRARHRLALTGTPIENRLEELWSIMDFLNPGYLGSLASFRREFINPIEKHGDKEKSALLKRFIQPFLLRREKTDKRIIKDLPEKSEEKVFCHLTETQASMYQNVVEDLSAKMAKATGIQRKGLILSTLTRLKQICDHPGLVSIYDEQRMNSGKLISFFELMDAIMEAEQSVLVFTQYVKMGKILMQALQQKYPDVPVEFLHGSVPVQKREKMIQQFQENKGKGVFILSLKAGGFGLNLTSANHVIHYDRWWNPAVEEQATDRTYRIGQRRDVHVYKLISEGTLEKRIDELIEKKKGLAGQILGNGEGWVTEMTDQEILDLVQLRKQVVQ
ncbi:SNF2 family DNA or RNA helicase [Pullulanibacillus pueri]|uniref:ATP-dependent helicase n=1 Tax=Pullulanibacillus pueri TaxID=1437324 RepID=A0A8J2ZWL0_9BACL|nr:DEAD/DEAH box helicase [Pullulanibacillus pueri]MBM7682741.1 SNF2 family DNA or RNA helicase [Pullulanibacillus pueri]GGH83007.1 ATP-dependent helicase [Pullulanibacillus pueri]